MSEQMDELLKQLQTVDGVYCPECDRMISFEEVVTDSGDRRLECTQCVGECATCSCKLAAIYCFVSRNMPWLLGPLQVVAGGCPETEQGKSK